MKLKVFLSCAVVGALLAFGFIHYWPQFVHGGFIIAASLTFALFGLNNIVGWIETVKNKMK